MNCLRDEKPADKHVVITGRNAHASLIEMADLVTLLSVDVDAQIDVIDRALAQTDATLRAAIHRIKNNAQMIGAGTLVDAAARLRPIDDESPAARLERLRMDWELTRDALFEALRKRWHYGTTGTRLFLDLRATFEQDVTGFSEDPKLGPAQDDIRCRRRSQ